MSKVFCLHCNKAKSSFDKDYADFQFKNKAFVFPSRIIFPKIPKTAENRYICSDCATKKYPLSCKAHGKIKGEYNFGNSPKCKKCEDDFLKIQNGNLPNSFRALMPLTKISNSGKLIEKNIWFTISNRNNVHLIGKNYHFSTDFENFSYKASIDNSQLSLSGHHNELAGEFFQIVCCAND